MDLMRDDLRSSGMAGIDQRFELVGAAAVDLIAERLSGNQRGLPETPKALRIPGRWVEGDSLPLARVRIGIG